ncbi:MAG TPA: AI-2E family transporter [Gemmatimonadaceae bacterium]|nr:AI-2E family transporter [Gemmatimonadaceae bacterium]
MARPAEVTRDAPVTTATTPTPLRIHRIEITARTVFTTLLVVAGCWMLVKLAPVIVMVVAALMLVGSLNPTVERLEARGWKRGLAIGTVFSVLLVIAALLLTFTLPELVAQASSLMEREPVLREQLASWLSQRKVTAPLAASLRRIDYGAMMGDSSKVAIDASMRAVEILAYTFGAVFLALYVMLDRDRLRGALFAVVPRTHHIALSRILLNLERIVGGYIRGQVITCVLMGVFIFALLAIAGVKSALAIAVFAGAMDVLPYIGGLLIFGPAVLAALIVSPVTAAVVGSLILVYQEVESRLLIPMVYGRSLRLPSSVVLVALVAGTVLYGIVGAMLALPVAAAALMLIEELRVELPGESETPQKEQQREQDIVSEMEYTERTEGMPAHEAAAVAIEITDDRAKAQDASTEEKPDALLGVDPGESLTSTPGSR